MVLTTTNNLRCIQCKAIEAKPQANFRCSHCGNLLESLLDTASLDAPALKQTWLQRRLTQLPVDQSGVWRFREMLPAFPTESVITVREGNTPLYQLPRCAHIAKVDRLLAKHQGMNPTGSF